MSSYQIVSTVSGQDLGTWEGETPAEALDAMSRAAGYCDHVDACERSGDDGAHLDVQESVSESAITQIESELARLGMDYAGLGPGDGQVRFADDWEAVRADGAKALETLRALPAETPAEDVWGALDKIAVAHHDCAGGPDGDPCPRPATVKVHVAPLDVHLCADHAAEKAGEEWAENEAAALTSPPSGPWTCTPGDARPLVASDDSDERLRLAQVCNDAAGRRWAELVEEYAAAQDDEDTDVDVTPKPIEITARAYYARETDCGVEGGIDVNVNVAIGEDTDEIDGEVTLVRDHGGGWTAYGDSPDHWISSELLIELRKLERADCLRAIRVIREAVLDCAEKEMP
jgi:hypothetical protein